MQDKNTIHDLHQFAMMCIKKNVFCTDGMEGVFFLY